MISLRVVRTEVNGKEIELSLCPGANRVLEFTKKDITISKRQLRSPGKGRGI